MSTIFTKIMNREIPGHFVYEDDLCAVIATIEPITDGHMLVIPRQEYESYTQCDPKTLAHLFQVARLVGLAQEQVYDIKRSGLIVAGFEVPHLHIHVVGLRDEKDLNLSKAKPATAESLAENASLIRSAIEKILRS